MKFKRTFFVFLFLFIILFNLNLYSLAADNPLILYGIDFSDIYNLFHQDSAFVIFYVDGEYYTYTPKIVSGKFNYSYNYLTKISRKLVVDYNLSDGNVNFYHFNKDSLKFEKAWEGKLTAYNLDDPNSNWQIFYSSKGILNQDKSTYYLAPGLAMDNPNASNEGYSIMHNNQIINLPKTVNYLDYDYAYTTEEYCDYIITYCDGYYYLFFYKDQDANTTNYFAFGAHYYKDLADPKWYPALYNFNGVTEGLETDNTVFRAFAVYKYAPDDTAWTPYDCMINNDVYCRGDYNIFGDNYEILFSSKDIYNTTVSTIKDGNYYYLDTSNIIFNKHVLGAATNSSDILNGNNNGAGGTISTPGKINSNSTSDANSSITNGFNNVKDKFSFVDNIKTNVTDMVNAIKNTNSNSKFQINVKSKYYTGPLTILDLSWYAPYKEFGDTVICVFAYSTFLWEIFKRLPDIISGAGASSYSVSMVNDILTYNKTGFGRSRSGRRRE